MSLFDYAPTDFPADTAATGMPQVFGAEVPLLLVIIAALVVADLAAMWIGRRAR